MNFNPAWLQTLTVKVLVAIAALALAFGLGWKAHSEHADAKRLDAVSDALSEYKRELARSTSASTRIEAAEAAERKKSDDRKRTLRAHLEEQKKQGDPHEKPPLLGESVLDDATVRMLNDARGVVPSGVRAAGGNPQEGGATAGSAAVPAGFAGDGR